MKTFLIKKTILTATFSLALGFVFAQQLHVEHLSTTTDPIALFEDTGANNFSRVVWGNTSTSNEWRLSSRAFNGGSASNLFDINFYDSNSAINFIRLDGDNFKTIISQDVQIRFDRLFVGLEIPLGGQDTQTQLDTQDKLVSTYIKNSNETTSSTSAALVQNIASGTGNRTGVDTYATSTTGDAIALNATGNSTGGGSEYGVYASASGTVGQTSYAVFANGNLHHTGSITGPSDKRLKKNINNLGKGVLSKLMQLESKTYEYDHSKYPSMNFAQGPQIGFLAQDLQLVFPEVVKEQKTHNF